MKGALMLCLLACDDTLFGPVPVADTGAILAPTYDDVEAIWSQRCAGCHTDGGAQAGLSLDTGDDALVGVASTQVPALALISHGDPESSYLWLKITDGPEIIGSPMPQGAALSAGCVSKALGSDDPGVEGRVFSMLTTCEVGTIEDIVMPAGSLVISVLNVSSVDAPSDGGPGFDLTKPMLQWAQSTDRYLNITCETDEVLIFYMEE